MKKAIITLGTRPGDQKGQDRLVQSLINVGYDGAVFTYRDEAEVGAPKHKDNPYAFKAHAFEHVRKQGYDLILWVDSSFFAISDVQPLFDIMEQDGYLMEEAGHWTGTWSTDRCLTYYGLTRNEAMQIPMYSAGFTGLNFNHELAKEFFKHWLDGANKGLFRGSWTNRLTECSKDPRCEGHRHDMTVASIIASKLEMKYQTGGTYLEYMPPGKVPNKETVIFGLQGMH